jgi:hypothetical protein
VTDHDPLCPSTDATEIHYCALCHCDLIAKVRTDAEKEWVEVYRSAIRECAAIISGLECESAAPESEWVNKWKAAGRLRALLEPK